MAGVVILRDDYTPWHNRVVEQLGILKHAQIKVGVLGSSDGELLRIARIHEFGATITPKSAKNLAIPLKPSMRGKSPRDIKNTFFLESDGHLYLVRESGDTLDFLFILLPRVTIPERSFIRGGYDASKDKLAQACKRAVQQVVYGNIDAATAAAQIGNAAVGILKRYMRSGPFAPKSSITLASAPGKTTPLISSGRLINAIAYEVTGI